MSRKLPQSNARRLKKKDDKLWLRDKERASTYSIMKIPCPCNQHIGTGLSFKIEEIKKHLIRYGRSVECRTWRRPQEADSSDEEWESEFSSRLTGSTSRPTLRDNGLEMQHMVREIYQQGR